MTYRILTDDTKRIICCSNVRSADNASTPNLRLDLNDGERSLTEYITSGKEDNKKGLMIIKPEDMIGRTFLSDLLDNGENTALRSSNESSPTRKTQKTILTISNLDAHLTMMNMKISLSTMTS